MDAARHFSQSYAEARDADVAILHLHALNPYGFSWWRRTTQENVDLNRNFQDFSRPLPANAGYDTIAHWLVPETWPPTPEIEARLAAFASEHGPRALQEAVSGGQYAHPEGLFYGGVNPTWSHVTLRHVLRAHGRHCRRLGWIDLHTGLGPIGQAKIHPGNELMSIYLFEEGYFKSDYGRGAAISLLMLAIVGVLSIVYVRRMVRIGVET